MDWNRCLSVGAGGVGFGRCVSAGVCVSISVGVSVSTCVSVSVGVTVPACVSV